MSSCDQSQCGTRATAFPRRNAGRLWKTLGLFLIVLAAGGTLLAQEPFPPDFEPLVPVYQDDFAMGVDLNNVWQVSPAGSGTWVASSDAVSCSGAGAWGTHLEELGASPGNPTGLVLQQSLPGNSGYNPGDWGNIRIEFDFQAIAGERIGFAWGLQPDTNGDGYPDAGYFFVIDHTADQIDGLALWHLIRRENDVNVDIPTGGSPLETEAGTTVTAGQCYRLRIDWFCGNLRVFLDDGSGWSAIKLLSRTNDYWSDPVRPLTPGGVGFWHGTTNEGGSRAVWDNLTISKWTLGCGGWCSAWTPWTVEGTDRIPFKIQFDATLADANLIDYDAIWQATNLCPDESASWDTRLRMAVDLPNPLDPPNNRSLTPDAPLVRVFDRVAEVSAPEGNFQDFVYSPNGGIDKDGNETSFPIVPLASWGATPIKRTLKAAYEWYKEIRTDPDSAKARWSDQNDPEAQCRKWYIIFITDGEESCDRVPPDTLPEVCQWLNGSSSFQNPDPGLAPVPIYTIGYSATVDENTPLSCMSTQTHGAYKSVTHAGELTGSILSVFNKMDADPRTFLPVTVAPEPATLGSSFSNEFLLTIPIFIPITGSSVWDGNYYAFQINPSHPIPPMKDVYDNSTPPKLKARVIDTDQAKWDATAQIATQIASTDASTSRKIFYSRQSGTGHWTVRTSFPSISSNSALLAEFEAWTGIISDPDPDTEASEMVNFVTGKAGTRQYPLGDIFHSKPLILGPPNDFQYYFNNIHDYFTDFMSPRDHRRRVAFVGSNDALFHAFDAGFYDRDDGGQWNDTFDLGTGTELFAYVPHAVLDPQVKPSSVKTMTFGGEQVYSVDGPVASADVYIDPSGGSDRKWRTVVLFGLRRGGRGITALDVTQPDPINAVTGEPQLSVLPGCLNGGSGCSGEYPKTLWEFTPDQDSDSDGDGEADLGLTWSTPVITRVKVQGGDDAFVAFFGGGMPVRSNDSSDHTGRFLYGLNVATGTIVYKANIGSAVPGGLAVLDQNDDGFTDRIYFGDTAGGLWRLDVTNPAADTGGGSLDTSSWTLTKIYQFDTLEVTDASGNPTGTTTAAEFFMMPKLVPVSFNGGTYTWGIAIGSGDRAQIGKMDAVRNRFYFVMDVDDTTRDETDLHPVDLGTGKVSSDTSFFNPTEGEYGWFLRLRPNEKVSTKGIIVSEKVLFGTFEARPPGGQGTCSAGGQGRIYQVYYNNVNPVNDTRGEETGGGLIGGATAYTVGDTTIAFFTHMDSGAENYTVGQHRLHRVTNWRQE